MFFKPSLKKSKAYELDFRKAFYEINFQQQKMNYPLLEYHQFTVMQSQYKVLKGWKNPSKRHKF